MRGLMNLLQLAHIFVAGMSLAPRAGELVTLQRDCVRRSRQKLQKARGRTYKLVERSGGKVREWVLPEIADKAIKQQARLVALAEQIGTKTSTLGRVTPGKHLWGQLGVAPQSKATERLLDFTRALCAYAEALDLDLYPGGQRLRFHRFRKTVARLVGLAIAEAPRVLMQVFGHASVESVLYYMLADRAFQLEVEQVVRALRVAKAAQAVEEMVKAEEDLLSKPPHGGWAGPAAAKLHESTRKFRRSLHESGESWGAESAGQLAEILTLQGRHWQLVREGVLCTKLPGESGTCNKSKGRPEPSKCGSTCLHRLEEPLLRADTDSAIRSCVDELERVEARDDTFMAGFWAGQIRAAVVRFEDLEAKWSEHPTVARAMAGAA